MQKTNKNDTFFSAIGINDPIEDYEYDEKEDSIILTLSLKKQEQQCPKCFNLTSSIHDKYIRKINGGILYTKKLLIRYIQKRYLCSSCNSRFIEKNTIVSKKYQLSRVNQNKLIELLKTESSYYCISKLVNTSAVTVSNYLDKKRKKTIEKTTIGRVLSIDEITIQKETPKYACVIYDNFNNRIYDIIYDRRVDSLEEYFSSIDFVERMKVEFFIMDLWKPYKKTVKKYFPNATIIADKFHYLRHVNWALRDTRIEISKNTTDPILARVLKKNWRIIQTPRYKLTGFCYNRFTGSITQKKDLINEVARRSEKMKLAFDLYDMAIAKCDNKNILSLIEAKRNIKILSSQITLSGLEKFINLLTIIKNWKNEIINSLVYRDDNGIKFTNGKLEGVNNFLKTVKKIAYGITNFKRYFYRCMLIFNSRRLKSV